MKTRKEILKNPDYWFQSAQLELYREVEEYLKNEKITKLEFAKRLGVTKGYISQTLNGNFNYTLKKLIQLSLAMGKVPVIEYKNIEDILNEEQTHVQRGAMTCLIKEGPEFFELTAHKLIA